MEFTKYLQKRKEYQRLGNNTNFGSVGSKTRHLCEKGVVRFTEIIGLILTMEIIICAKTELRVELISL